MATYDGTVVSSLQPDVATGRLATIGGDGIRVTVVQEGRLRAEWTDAQATVSVRHCDVEQTYTPTWAIVLGLITLPLFGLGLLFWCIRCTGWAACTRTSVLIGGLPMVTLEDLGTARQAAPLEVLRPLPTAA